MMPDSEAETVEQELRRVLRDNLPEDWKVSLTYKALLEVFERLERIEKMQERMAITHLV